MALSELDILQTKLTPPAARADRILRPRLTEQLNDSLKYPLTLVCAPAGYGKSTLIADWLASDAAKRVTVAWLSLDEDDSEITRFLTYFVGALECAIPEIGRDLYYSLRLSQPPPKSVLTALINRLNEHGGPVVLVLDDYHTVANPAVHEAIAFLLDHMPPAMHLFITSRADPPLPISRLRVRAQVLELRADDLRFTTDEAGDFLDRIFGLRPSDADIRALGERTEGWAAGLQLAALAMRGRDDLSAFIQAFAGNHRFIIDYLAEEVLGRQPDDVYRFLLDTSILDRMSADSCAAVTGSEKAAELLEYLERTNLFIVPLDQQGRWFRYHHLFGSVLLHRLRHDDPDRCSVLYTRASDWFKAQGLLDEAVRYALAARDLERAALIAESVSPRLDNQDYLTQLRAWFRQMPLEFIQSRPHLMIAYCWVIGLLDDYNIVDRLLDEAPSLKDPALPTEIRGRVALVRANVARWQHRSEASIAHAEEALRDLAEDDLSYRVFALVVIVSAHRRTGNLAAAEKARDDVLALARAAGNRRLMMWAMHLTDELLWWQGRPRDVIRNAEQLVRLYEQHERSEFVIGGLTQTYIAIMSYAIDDLDMAESMAKRGLELLRLTAERSILTFGYNCLSSVYLARGQTARAHEMVDQALGWFADMGVASRQARDMLSAQRARIWIEEGKLDAAVEWSRTWSPDPARLNERFLRELTLVRLNLVLNRRRPDQPLLTEAIALLDKLVEHAARAAWIDLLIECLCVQAVVFDALGDRLRALKTIERALILAEPGDFVRVFLDEGPPMKSLLTQAKKHDITPAYLAKLLAAFENTAPIESKILAWDRTSDATEPLSQRELEVLRLLADGASNREIAETLVVSIGTVKKHLNNIFLKLDAHSRTQVVSTARKQRLI